MTEAQPARDGTIAAGVAGGLGHRRENRPGATADLRRTGINPNFWYPVAVSGNVPKGKTFATVFAGSGSRSIAARAVRSSPWRTGAPTARCH